MSEELVTKDGTPLSKSLKRALFRSKMRALLLIAPLLIFIVISYILPIGNILTRSVDNSKVYELLPLTAEALMNWEGKAGETPPEALYATFAKEMQEAIKTRRHTEIGLRYNYDIPGISSKFKQLGREVKKWNLETDGPFKEKFIEIDPFWGEADTWAKIKIFSTHYTLGNYARSFDRTLTPDGIEKLPENQRYLVKLFLRTIIMSFVITIMTFILGYPVAWLLANIRAKSANLLMILVLLPFWTSLLVRTAGWKVSLQDAGVLNNLFLSIHEKFPFLFSGAPYTLMYNKLAVILAMTHILLPFMILPLYSVMKTIDPSYLRAAKSLGASNSTAFWRVYFPQTISGIGAGAILVFILAMGYYITPAIVGGTDGIFISNEIAKYVKNNPSLGAALATILLLIVMGLYYVYDRVVGIDNVKLG